MNRFQATLAVFCFTAAAGAFAEKPAGAAPPPRFGALAKNLNAQDAANLARSAATLGVSLDSLKDMDLNSAAKAIEAKRIAQTDQLMKAYVANQNAKNAQAELLLKQVRDIQAQAKTETNPQKLQQLNAAIKSGQDKFDDADKQQQADQKQAQSAADQFAAMQAQLRDILGKLQDILARSNKTNAI